MKKKHCCGGDIVKYRCGNDTCICRISMSSPVREDCFCVNVIKTSCGYGDKMVVYKEYKLGGNNGTDNL